MKAWRNAWLAAGLSFLLVVAACGGDDESAPSNDSSGGTAATTAAPSANPAPSSGAGGGELVIGDETITFDRARCFLQEQDAAGGGGKILFTAQAFGTNAAGDPITLDVSRYDEDSQFTGDDIILDIGDPFSDDAVSLASSADLGTVSVDGSTLSAGDLTFVNFDDFSEQNGSFEINC